MHTDVLIHKASGQKVYNIEKHYGLATIEYNPVEITHVAEQKMIPTVAKKDVPKPKNQDTKSLAKEDVSDNASLSTVVV